VNTLVRLLTSAKLPPVPTLDGAKLHCPTPITGSVPFRFALVPQSVWFPAGTEGVGFWSNLICTSSMPGAQTPLVIVHLNIYVWPAVPVKVLLYDEVLLKAVNGSTSGLPPGAKPHEPVPTAIGLLPASVASVPQMFWSAPAADTSGL
jgi:hypothetical protein